MKNIYAIAKECKNELNNIGIETGNIVSYKINTRAKKRWGQCSYSYGTYAIEISNRLLQDDVSDIATKTTMLHEMLHTCKDCMNHGKEWQALADKVNKAYGYNIKRTTTSSEKGVEPMQSSETVHYILHCENCGSHWEYKRYSKIVRCAEGNNAKCSCGCKKISVIHI